MKENAIWKIRNALWIMVFGLAILGAFNACSAQAFWPPDLVPHPHLPQPEPPPDTIGK